jgi:hypothetical protein
MLSYWQTRTRLLWHSYMIDTHAKLRYAMFLRSTPSRVPLLLVAVIWMLCLGCERWAASAWWLRLWVSDNLQQHESVVTAFGARSCGFLIWICCLLLTYIKGSMVQLQIYAPFFSCFWHACSTVCLWLYISSLWLVQNRTLNDELIISSTKSTLEPRTISKETLSMTSLAPSLQ